MSEPKITRIQLLTDTPTELGNTNVKPKRGEPIVFQDDNGTTLKIGDGNKLAAQLPNLNIGVTKATSITFGTDEATLNQETVSKLLNLANAVYANEEIKF